MNNDAVIHFLHTLRTTSRNLLLHTRIHARLLATLTLLLTSFAAHAGSSSGLSNMERCHEHAKQSTFGQDYDRTAISYCNKAIRFGSLSATERGRTYINRGVLFKNMLRINYAAGDFRRARLYLKKTPEIDVNTGNIAYLKGQFESALEYYDRALLDNLKQRHVAYLNRGLTQERLGNIEAAKQDYQRALRFNPDVENAQDRLIDLSAYVAYSTIEPNRRTIFY